MNKSFTQIDQRWLREIVHMATCQALIHMGEPKPGDKILSPLHQKMMTVRPLARHRSKGKQADAGQ